MEIRKRASGCCVWSLLVTVWMTLQGAAALAEGLAYIVVTITRVRSCSRKYGLMLTASSSMSLLQSVSSIVKCAELHHLPFTNKHSQTPSSLLDISGKLLPNKVQQLLMRRGFQNIKSSPQGSTLSYD
ncbi:hypothetical protein AMECASPLE_032693 [Ameca splendens]|uniref:Uncharacterized protein n=1 Tax=Ameca splendens TaxID=208324 RepID=A0ABV0Z4V6_9TELE